MDKIDWMAVIIALAMFSPLLPSLIEGIREKFFGGDKQRNPDL